MHHKYYRVEETKTQSETPRLGFDQLHRHSQATEPDSQATLLSLLWRGWWLGWSLAGPGIF